MEKQVNIAERKRLELAEAIRSGKVADPITLFVISTGVSLGVQFLSKALAPKAPMQQVGLMKGTVQLQNSQQGQFIPEIYGAGPAVTLVPGAATTWSSVVNASQAAPGKFTKDNIAADQVWNAGAVYATPVTANDDAFIQFKVDEPSGTFMGVAVGFSIDTTPASGAGVGGAPALEFGVQIQVNVTGEDASHVPILAHTFHPVIQGVGGPDLGTWYPGDVWRVEKRDKKYRLYRGEGEVANFTPTTPSATVYLAVSAFRRGYGLTTSYVKINDLGPLPSAGSGGCKVPGMIVWAKKPLKHRYISNAPQHGGKGHATQTIENIFYTIDIRAHFARGSGALFLLREYANTDIIFHDDPNLNAPSNVYNPSAGVVVAYTTPVPPDPSAVDNFAWLRSDNYLIDDPGDSIGGGPPSLGPQVVTVTAPAGTVISITYTTNLLAATLSNAGFIVKKNGVSDAVSSVTASGRVISVTVGTAFTAGDGVTVEYIGTDARTLSGLVVEKFDPWPVSIVGGADLSCPTGQHRDATTGQCVDDVLPGDGSVTPALGSASGAGAIITLIFSTNLLGSGSTISTADFAVLRNALSDAVTLASISGNQVILTLTDLIISGDKATIQYSGTSIVSATGGHVAAAFGPVDVEIFPGGGSGQVQQGSSGLVVYPGTDTQSVDPTEEADVDAHDGMNSTTAHRGMAGVVHTAMNLQRWQNIPPNLVGVWQHKSLKKLGEIYAYLVQRIVDQDNNPLFAVADFDFKSINNTVCRGMLLDGRRFAPAEIIDNPEIQDSYNYFSTEGDGKFLAFVNGDEPSITIPESEFGWLDGSASLPERFAAITVSKGDETKKPRQVDLKYINPGNDWEPDTQTTFRRVTLGNNLEQLQCMLTMNPDEARQMTARRIYKEHVGELVKFTLSWKYQYLFAGYRITCVTAAGITYIMRLMSITGSIGVRDCEAILLEPSAFSQNDVGPAAPIYNPAQQIPSVTVLAAMDVPAFRAGEDVQFGMYFAGTPRNTDTQTWNGFALFIKRSGVYEKIAEFPAATIMGAVVSVTGTLQTDPNVTDNTTVIVVDLYGSKSTLQSVLEADMIAGVNLAVVGDMIFGFAHADRVTGYLNRWSLSVLRNGKYNTEDNISSVVAGRNFAVLSDAVRFIPLDVTRELDTTLHFKAVSFGQSLGDASELTAICTGRSVRLGTPSTFLCFFDAPSKDALFEIAGSTPSQGKEEYELQITQSDHSTLLRPSIIINPATNRQLQEFVIWDSASLLPPGDPLTLSTDGGVTLSTVAGLNSIASAEVVGGFKAEFEIAPIANLPPEYVSIYPSSSYGVSADYAFSWRIGGTYPNYTARPDADFSDSLGPTVNITGGDRLGIVIRPDGVVEFHIQHGESSTPVWISSKKVLLDQTYRAYVKGPGMIQKVSWLRQGPEWKYTAGAQWIDNAMAYPATIYARVRQLSPFNQGAASPWVNGTFVRP